MTLPTILLISLGCTTQEGFEEDFSKAYCALLSDCEVLTFYGYRNLDDCEKNATATTKGCDFNDDKADTCLDDIEKTGCADLWEQTLPESCTKVCS